jgi:DNA-binding response OmpR family regulator
LVVDETKTIVHPLTMMLKKRGLRYFRCLAAKALELLQNITVDMILLDIQMGSGMDGFEVCKLLKYNPKTKDIPVMFLSTFDELETKLKGFEAGGVNFIAKSFDKTEVIIRARTSKIQREIRQLTAAECL